MYVYNFGFVVFLVEAVPYVIHTLFISSIIAADTPPGRNLKNN